MRPMAIGMTPPPNIDATGRVSETATFRERGGAMEERTVSPGGKKLLAHIPCRKMMTMTQESETIPNKTVNNPVSTNTLIKVGLGPKRSVTHPEANAIATPGVRDRANMVLAQLRSIPCPVTR